MKDYANYHGLSSYERQQKNTEKLFQIQYRTGGEGFQVLVDEKHEMQAIIQNNTNSKTELLEDKKMHFLIKDLENVEWGSVIKSSKLRTPYMVISRPDDNTMYATCSIRKANNRMSFEMDGITHWYDSILHIGQVYSDISYVNETRVFDEEDKRALIVKYDENTSKLKMFQKIYVDGIAYSIIKTENDVLREQSSTEGILQLVLLKQEPSTLTLNFKKDIVGILRFARLKERVYNSNSRELLTPTNQVKTGDYVTYYLKENERRTYIIRSMVDEFEDYDRTFMLICQKEVKFLDMQGNIVMYPISFTDNRTKMNEKDTWFVVQDTSAVEGYMKLDEISAQLSYANEEDNSGYVPNRFLIDGLAYRIIGTDRLSMDGLITLKLVMDKVDYNYDNLELGVADYYRYYAKNTNMNNIFVGKPNILIGNVATYQVETEDLTNIEWSLETEYDGITLLQISPRIVELHVANNVKLVGKTVQLKCDANGRIGLKTITIIGW